MPIVSPANDRTLVTAAQQGDREAVEVLLRRHQPRIYTICRRIAGNDADAADASQEAMISIVRGLPRYDGRAAFTTWMHRVATNACLDELRRRGRRPVVGLPDHEMADAAPPGGGPGPAFDDRLADTMVIDEALAELSPEFRAAVVLRDICGMDYAEIAETLGIRPGTVRSRIARGRRSLAARLGGNQEESDRRPSSRS